MHVLAESTGLCLPKSIHGVYLLEISHRLVIQGLFFLQSFLIDALIGSIELLLTWFHLLNALVGVFFRTLIYLGRLG